MANGTTNFHERLVETLPADRPLSRGEVMYRERLRQLALIVQRDLPQIQITFPEFTPHDWNMHIVPLFDVAKRLFGADALLALNDVDKFLLVMGLYGHDWGMAVGKQEREAIAAGAKSSNANPDYVLLRDELEILTDFARQQGLRKDHDGNFPSLLDDTLPYWAEYVRQTHAWRSGERVRRFLLTENGDHALGEAGWAVCAGHWLDFDQMQDARTIQSMRMVGDTRAHPRLVALIVRLTDLFDIGRNRTPYTLRRFIGPSDPRSVTEWDKHDALDPVDCVEVVGDKGRHEVVVRGKCENAALWPALIDLRDYLEDQLRHAIGMLSEENAILAAEPAPGLGSAVAGWFSRISPVLRWDVRSLGFKPSEVRFEFDRAATFRILAQEIYGKEPHVFLRELLQNSLDATRQLCARESQRPGRRAIEPRDLLIQFQVTKHTDGRITVTCRDYGIGMNEHIVSTYMARIGASYYTSTEYSHDQLPMDAVSRFGIGILSCFMVTDKVRVRSKRPEIYEGGQGLIVDVPGIDRHFQIYPLNDSGWEGTEVCVDVLPTKLAAFADGKGNVPEFNVAQYLLQTAGFIDVPIYIDDGEEGLLILHPDMDPMLRPAGVPVNVRVHQLRGSYRWPEELQRFEICPDPTVLSDHRVDLSKDLNLPDIAGFVTFPIPCSLDGDMRITSNGLLRGENLVVQAADGAEVKPVFAKAIDIGVRYPVATTPSSRLEPKAPNVLVYQDGIYVTGTGEIGQKIGDDPFPAHAWIDYRSSARQELTPSRNSLARDPTNSPGWIVIKARTHAFFRELERARSFSPNEKIRKLVQLEKFLGVSNGSVVEKVPWPEYPTLVLHPSGSFQYVFARDALMNGFRTVPLAFARR